MSPVLGQFGAFAFDQRQRILTRDGKIVPLAPKDLEILLALLQKHGQIVEKKEIIERVWPETFVEEANLSRHIFNLRQILSEDGVRSIETVPKRGYRLVMPISLLEPVPAPAATPPSDGANKARQVAQEASANGDTPPNLGGLRKIHFRRWQIWVLLALTVMAIGITAKRARSMPSRRVSIVVLPIQNLTGDPSKDYICDSLAVEMIAQIGMLGRSDFGAIPWTSSLTYKPATKSAKVISQELNAEYLIEGSLRESADHFRITAKLIHFPEQTTVWVHEFDRRPADLIGMEEEIGISIANMLADVNRAAPRRD